jgi:hypothetical protein
MTRALLDDSTRPTRGQWNWSPRLFVVTKFYFGSTCAQCGPHGTGPHLRGLHLKTLEFTRQIGKQTLVDW